MDGGGSYLDLIIQGILLLNRDHMNATIVNHYICLDSGELIEHG